MTVGKKLLWTSKPRNNIGSNQPGSADKADKISPGKLVKPERVIV